MAIDTRSIPTTTETRTDPVTGETRTFPPLSMVSKNTPTFHERRELHRLEGLGLIERYVSDERLRWRRINPLVSESDLGTLRPLTTD